MEKLEKPAVTLGFHRPFFINGNAYEQFGKESLINKKPCPEHRAFRMPIEIEEKILYIRKNYHLEPDWITWYLNTLPLRHSFWKRGIP